METLTKTHTNCLRCPSAAFTLVELLVVIAIIGILAAILIPVVGKVRVAGYKAESTSNLRSLHSSMMLFAQDNNNLLPFAFTIRKDGQGRTMGSWMNQLYRDGYIETDAETMPEARIFGCPQQRAQFPREDDHRTYGMNQRIGGYPASNPSVGARTVLQAESPPKTALLMNGVWNGASYSASADAASYITNVTPSFGDSVLILYLDGHVSLTEVISIPTDLSQRDGLEFWRGGVPLD